MIKIFLFLLSVFLPFGAAHADTVYKEAYLSCDPEKNAAMVRFEAGWVGNPRNIKLPAQYSKYDYLNDLSLNNECVLKDGRKITLSYDVGQAYAYGQGGGDPPAYFNLKVGDKYAYYHKPFYRNFSSEFLDPLVILISAKSLTSCKGPSSFSDAANYVEQHINENDCDDESQRLALGVENYPDELNALNKKIFEDSYSEISMQPEACEFFKSQKLSQITEGQKYADPGIKTPLGRMLERVYDINNDGNDDEILQFSSATHYMDGMFYVVANKGEAKSIKECVLKQICPAGFSKPKEGSADVEDFIKAVHKFWPNSYTVSGEDLPNIGYSARYTGISLIVFLNRTYIYFQPLNNNSFPRAVIGEILPNKKIDIICTYKGVLNGRTH